MADYTGSTYISASIQYSNAVPTVNPQFSGSRNSRGLLRKPSDVTGSLNSKMAAAKPEVLISQRLDQISTPFQSLTPIFGIHEFNVTITNT